MSMRWAIFATLGCGSLATLQLCAQPARVPVVLLNGYQATCTGTSDSSATFGAMQSLLTADGWQVSFFDNCSVSPGTTGSARPNIEQLAQAFGDFLQKLGAPEVDVVAHSMGGLIVRSYLAGKLPQGGFSPPPLLIFARRFFLRRRMRDCSLSPGSWAPILPIHKPWKCSPAVIFSGAWPLGTNAWTICAASMLSRWLGISAQLLMCRTQTTVLWS